MSIKKFIFIFLFLNFLLIQNLYSQSKWFWQNPLPQGNELRAVKFIDQNTGWAVGIKGTIIKSTDGGLNWVILNSGTSYDLFNLLFISIDSGFAIGSNGLILSTVNGGINWRQNQLTGNINLTGIYFNNKLTGWISGFNYSINHGVIYKTINGGINWTLNYISPSQDNFTNIYFNSYNSGWVDGSTLFKTTNNGDNWNLVNGYLYSNDFIFKDSLNGLAVGERGSSSGPYGHISKTTNGGIDYYTSFTYPDTNLNSLSFENSFTGYTAGEKGKIMKTTNYGNSWFPLQSNTYNDLNSIFFYDSLKGWSAGKNGSIIKSENGGNNWQSMRRGLVNIFYLGQFINQNTGWISSAAGISKTTDGGQNWSIIWDSVYTFNNYSQFFFLNENTGWLLYHPLNPPFGNALYKTNDGGKSWSYQSTIFHSYPVFNTIYSINFIDELNGHLVGTQIMIIPPFEFLYTGIHLKTIDGGLNWDINAHNPSKYLNDIKFLNINTGIIVGDNGTILKTANAGLNWNSITGIYGNAFGYSKISLINENIWWLIGGNKICKTTNGGQNWQDQSNYNFPGLYSISFLDENYGWVCGNQGAIYATSNGGTNWIYQPSPTNQNLNSISFVNQNVGWAIGDNGTIIKTNSGIIPNGIKVNTMIIPKSFDLQQNYPNPFNPNTIINYELPITNYVTLKVYNILGKEVATLINHKQNAGNYTVDFDGSNLPSGIYFYKLETENFSETKRMILLK